MPWWGWMVLGIGLLGAEMFVIDAQFYLVFIGLSAAVVGLLGLFSLHLPNWAQWLVFSALAIVAMVSFRRRLYQLVRKSGGRVVNARLEPGQSGRVEYRGTSWSARNIGTTPIESGREALIAQVDGLTLHVTAE
jgi:membrane protein implicated in regulation of membrane protease activity